MIESIDNYIQLVFLGISAGISFYKAVVTRMRSWVLVTIFYSAFFMGSLYWQLYFALKGNVPEFYVSELSWYVSYLFLYLFLKYQKNSKTDRRPCRIKWLIPLFAGGLSIYYMTFGQIFSNLISALLMSLVAMEAVTGLYLLKDPGAEGLNISVRMKPVYVLALVFFFLEYALWTSSCIWQENSFLNPYYYIDMAISVTMLRMALYIREALKYTDAKQPAANAVR